MGAGHDDSDGFFESGRDHQLKMVFNPEQVEFLSQQIAGGALDTLAEGADALLAKADGAFWSGGSGPIVVDAAAKVVALYESAGTGRVEELYVQTECGCGGGATQGLKTEFEYFAYVPSPHANGSITNTTKITESKWDVSSWTARRTVYFDSGPPVDGGVLYLINEAVVSGGDKWVVHHAYDSGTRVRTRTMSPAAMDSYTAGTSIAAPSYAAESALGLVYAYEHDADARLTIVRRANGDKGSTSNFDKLFEIAYGDGSGSTRKHLPASFKRYRVAGSSSADDVELTTFTYGFHNTGQDDVEWTQIEVEAELVAENGPGGTYSRYEIFDDAGRNTWSRSEDLALTKRTFQTGTGEVAQVTSNTSTSGIPSLAGVSTGGWGRSGDGGSLVTTYTRDKLGRVQTVTAPTGAETYTYREMRPFSFRGGIDYYAEVSLPHIIDAGTAKYGGPATVTVLNATGRTIGRSGHALGASAITLSSGVVSAYTLGTELTRSVVDQDVSGLVTMQTAWHDIAGNGYYETEFTYDSLGRKDTEISATGTITRYSYDVLDRQTKIEIGTDDDPMTGDMVAVTEYFYDSGGTATSGMGDGHMTLVRQHVDGSTVRDTIYTHDYRGNQTITENEAAPHEFKVYDFQDRLVENAVFSSVPSGIATTLADRGRYTTTSYSQRGMVYRQRTAIDATSGSPTFLAAHTWRDETGRPVCEWRPNAPATKMTYDGLGRVKTSYVTTRGGDADPGASGNHADALALTGDLIAEQTTYRYISGEGLLDLVTRHLRAHDASGTGDLTGLGSANSIAMYSASYYDDAGRQIRSVQFGTNNSNGFEHGGSAPTITQASPPSPSAADATKLVTSTAYNSRGLAELVTGPDEHVTKTIYDDMNRRIAVIENFDDATIAWSSGDGRWESTDCGPDDEDRVTSYVYDGMNHITKLTAHLPDGSGGELVQTTQYVYGVAKGSSAGDSEVGSFNLLAEIRYPDPSTGDPGSSASDKVFHAYNRLGELVWKMDQNADIHEYTRDGMGRVTADVATIDVSSPADDWVDAITTTYDGFGRRDFVRSRDGGVSGTIKNAVQFTYTSLWEVKDVWQDHDSDVDTGGGASNSRKVTYTYTTAAAGAANTNISRVSRVTYPDGSHFDYGYETGLRRVNEISRPAGFVTVSLVGYQYIGMGIPAVVDHIQPDVLLDHTVAHNGDRTSGEYPGMDRYGRVVRQAWVDGGLTTHATDGTVPNIPPIVELGYGYDNHGNRTYIRDLRPGAKRAGRDWAFTHDGLGRLTAADKGVHGGSWTYSPGSEKWTLDMLGNWSKFEKDGDGD